ncbi:MAG: hypothetical protein CL867_08590 [Cytophagaceae bacterium]|nr:hypothetical protein [Cytophagaceae bacterium]
MRFLISMIVFGLTVISCTSTSNDNTIALDKASIGMKVPDLNIYELEGSSLIQKSLYDYQEEVIILDFWATWCGPCLTAFPKLSSLQQQYPDRLKVLAITDESPERIRSFLDTRPQEFTVAIDTSGVINRYFEHRVIPHYVILDAQKVVKAVVHSDFITKENIDKILAGEAIEFKEKKENLAFDYRNTFGDTNQEVIYQSTLLPYNPDASSVSNIAAKGNRIFAYNLTYPALLRMAYDMPYTRVIENFTTPARYEYKKENQYCYEMIFPERLRENRLKLMQAEIAALSGIKARLETKETEVYLLQKIPNTTITLPVSTQSPDPNAITRYGQGISMQGQPMADLTNYFENVLERPVIDQTGYTKVYDLEVKWYIEDPAKGLATLAPYGLELVKSKRPITFLVLED